MDSAKRSQLVHNFQQILGDIFFQSLNYNMHDGIKEPTLRLRNVTLRLRNLACYKGFDFLD